MTYAYYAATTLPKSGDIVWCHFPLREMPGGPGPKPRPAIVRRTFLDPRTGRGSVEVAFGTGKKLKTLYRGEFVVASPGGMRAAGLDLPTKFDLARTVRLPWARQFFAVKPGHGRLVMGALHPADVMTLKRAAGSLPGPG